MLSPARPSFTRTWFCCLRSLREEELLRQDVADHSLNDDRIPGEHVMPRGPRVRLNVGGQVRGVPHSKGKDLDAVDTKVLSCVDIGSSKEISFKRG